MPTLANLLWRHTGHSQPHPLITPIKIVSSINVIKKYIIIANNSIISMIVLVYYTIILIRFDSFLEVYIYLHSVSNSSLKVDL